MTDVHVGVHVGTADPLTAAAVRGADLVQIFLGNPQSWKKPPERADAEALATAELPIYVHAPYLVNVASANNRIRIPSRKILADTIEAAERIRAAGIIVHGGHVTDDEDVAAGFPRWRKALEQLETDIPIIIENTAGGTNAMARRIDVLDQLWDVIGDMNPGFCLDTCHAWAGGENPDGIVDRVMDAIGRIDLVHLNDSRDPFDSRRDRHTNLGYGEIDPDYLVEIVHRAGAPAVIETPGGVDMHQADLEWIRSRIARR